MVAKAEQIGPRQLVDPAGMSRRGKHGCCCGSDNRHGLQLHISYPEPGAACTELTRLAMVELLRQSRELGGNAVYDVQAKATRNWVNEPLCRNELDSQRGGKMGIKRHVTRLRGTAVYDPGLPEPAVGDGPESPRPGGT